jgi:hypothetical protein
MQMEASDQVCPLCRQSTRIDCYTLPDRELSTRLCQKCRLMIDLIRPASVAAQHKAANESSAAHWREAVFCSDPSQAEIRDCQSITGCSDSSSEGLCEWPLLVDGPRPARRNSLLVVAATVLLIACGTVIYLVRDPDIPARHADTGPDRAGQASGKLEAMPQPFAPTPADVEATGQKLLTIQAAAFPSESAARAFSEKLTRAGIPAYTVSAEIGRRGKWFRVRAGRFGSREEANSYLRAWQQQAARAGIGAQFVVTDYD